MHRTLLGRPSPSRFAIRLVIALLGLAAVGEVRAEMLPALDDFLCVRGGPARRIDHALLFVPRLALSLRDGALGDRSLTLDVRKSLGLCLPASLGGDALVDGATFLESYGARLTRTRPTQNRPTFDVQRVTNRFGSDDLHLKGITDVLIPSAAVLDPPPAAITVPSPFDDFSCYEAERAGGLRGLPAAPAPLTIASAIGTWQFDVKAPTRLCFPADLGGTDPSAPSHRRALACYRAKLTRTKPPQGKPFPRQVATANRFGSEQLALTTTLDLCVPSDVVGANATATPARTATPTPTLTPPPGFTLEVAPKAVTVDIGTSTHFTATAVFTDGAVVDFTERVQWRSSTAAATAPNVAGDRGRVDAVDGGSAVISAYDEATGVTSTDTGGDAILTVNWTLERIELLPTTVTRGLGESVRLRATGYFAGGYTRSIAERLVYASSDPSVAAPTNAATAADHSRVVAVGEGTAVLSATDPITGLSSTATGGDVAMIVLPPMERCEINSGAIGMTLHDHFQFTAIGYYAGGFQRVVTQQVEYTSADPSIVEAPNPEGDRSRVLAITPGETTITATDTVTGIECFPRTIVRVGVPSSLYLRPPDPLAWFPKRAGRSWQAIAIEKYSPPVGKDYVTEDVVFTSSDPTIVAAPNVPGNRGRLDAVGSGTASIIATDPRNGLVSQAITLRSLDGLTRVAISDGSVALVDVGHTFFLSAVGHFADGPASLEPSDLLFVSDNPAVATVLWNGLQWRVRALAPGFATISATDVQTGISSDAFGESLRIGVRGPVERITLVPPTVARRVGESQAFAAILHYVGGTSEIGTQQLTYSSSAPDVAVAANSYYVRSRVDALSGGTATITATDPASGISSADSGESATITVVGPLTRVHIQPSQVTRSAGRSFSFTAIGNDAAGRTINVTQDVTWSSSDTDVARALNPEGNRSRVDARFRLGSATIRAYDPPSGVTSSDSGDDATFVTAGSLERLGLSTTQTVLRVGETIQLTATGYLSNQQAVNLTQEVEYVSENPSVARADNMPGDRSRITAIKPGSAIITARDPGTGVTPNSNDRVTLVVTP